MFAYVPRQARRADAARSRKPVIASSRATMTTTIQAATCLFSMNAMKAEQVRILSARDP